MTDGRTDRGNDNTRRPKLASGNKTVVKLVDSTARDIRPGTPKDLILVSFNLETPRLSVDA